MAAVVVSDGVFSQITTDGARILLYVRSVFACDHMQKSDTMAVDVIAGK